MARARKCIKCKNKSTDYKIHKNKAICGECYVNYMNAHVQCSICGKTIKRLKEYQSSDISKSDLQKIFCSKACHTKLIHERDILDEIDKWLKSYFKMDKLNPRIYIQLNEFQSKFNMTPEGILYTLKYIKEETNKELLNNSITIVTWYYETAKKHYIEKQKIKSKIKDFNSKNENIVTKTLSDLKVYRPIDTRKNDILITEIDFD